MTFPVWQYYPRSARPPAWVHTLGGAFETARSDIDTVAGAPVITGADEVLNRISPQLQAEDPRWSLESPGNRLFHPVFFGENGAEGAGTGLRFEIDGFLADENVVLEVMYGGAVQNNGIYKAIVEGVLIADANHIALCLPVRYPGSTSPYAKARDILGAIFESRRMKLPDEIEGVLVLGF